MRLCRFGEGRLGVVEGAGVTDVTQALDALPSYRYPLPTHDVLIANLDAVVARARALARDVAAVPLESVRLVSPVANPGKIVAAPVNYQKHLEEVRGDAQLHNNNPGNTLTIQKAGVFLKATSSLVGPGEGITIRRADRRTDHEVELAVIIGRAADRVSRAEAMRHVAGYAIGLDISIRGTEDRSFRKSPDTYTVLGPWLVTADEIPDPGALDLQIAVNGDIRQRSNTRHMILSVAELIELASTLYTLHPGDVILTGTPDGVSPIEAGDEIVAEVERVGAMRVAVGAADVDSVAAAGAAAAGGA